jgi:hypothetical protein
VPSAGRAAGQPFVASRGRLGAVGETVSPSIDAPETVMTASIPAWVPVLFVALAFVGYRLSQPRTVRPGKLLLIALAMFAWSLYGLLGSFGLAPLALLLWALGYGAALTLGVRHFTAQGLTTVGDQVHLPGSWVPLGLLMGIFSVRFVLGTAMAMHSPMLQDLAFIAGVSLVLGMLSGGFGARALAALRAQQA